MAERKQSVVLFPFMAQGHIIPFLALALRLEQTQRNLNIFILNTSSNINKLKSHLPPNSSVNLIEIPFDSSQHGLPPNTENTDTIPYHLVIKLLQASTSMKPAFKQVIQTLTRQHQTKTIIIADIFFGWTAPLAKELGAFHVIFSSSGGYGLACYYSLWMNLPHRRVCSDEFQLPDFPEARAIHRTQLPANIAEADGSDAWSLFQKKNLSEWVNSDGILFNTVKEFDEVGLNYFTRKLGIPAWPIGPVLLSGSRGMSPELCREWLDTKPRSSVIFVCFGSMNTISASQMMELALALEKSNKNFVWVVRSPIGFDINSEFRSEEWFPEGFIDKVEGARRGMIIHKWAPQVEILRHKAVSAFLSHCGWNSVLESLSHGVPILGWPMAAEQFFNCKYLEEEVGVCVEVARGNRGEVRHEDIVGKIEVVMNETVKGVAMRNRACEIRDIIGTALNDERDGFEGSSVIAVHHFLSAALSSTLPNQHPHAHST